jgi:hypothetical protein
MSRLPHSFVAAAVCLSALLALPDLAQAQFTQQGEPLVGTGSDPYSYAGQGNSVALSADGNTAIVGGPSDNFDPTSVFGVGAVWVYTRSNGVWTQQGAKLVGTDAVTDVRPSATGSPRRRWPTAFPGW